MVISDDSENESEAVKGPSPLKTRSLPDAKPVNTDDSARIEQRSSSTASSKRRLIEDEGEEKDEESSNESLRSAKSKRSSNTARCSRGRKSSKLQPIGAHNHKVSSFKPLNMRTVEREKVGVDGGMKPSSGPNFPSAKNSSEHISPRSSASESESDKKDYQNPPSVTRSVTKETSSEESKADEIENGEDNGEGGLSPTLADRSPAVISVPLSQHSKKRKMRAEDSDQEDDTRVAMELGSFDVVYREEKALDLHRSHPPSDAVSEEEQSINEEVAQARSSSLVDDTAHTKANASPANSHLVSRLEMNAVIEQLKQEMREEMNKMKEALRIDTKRLIRSEVKDEISLAREDGR
jgi:hypothetical protein